jgi:hypothetical protein
MTKCSSIGDLPMNNPSLVPDDECVNNPNDEENDPKLQNKLIAVLQNRLETLYKCISDPQMIHIYNFEHLQLQSVAHTIKHKVDTLFFEADIPPTWKLDITWSFNPVLVVHVTMLNYLVKEKAKEMLSDYFSSDYRSFIEP